VRLSALIVALAIVVVGLGLAPALAGSRRGPTVRGLSRRVAALEARAACTRIVAPVSQFGQDGDPLNGTGFFYIDNTDPKRTQIYTTSGLDLDPGSATPTMYVVTVSPKCVTGSQAMFGRTARGGGRPH
jgi:hypothetical protein